MACWGWWWSLLMARGRYLEPFHQTLWWGDWIKTRLPEWNIQCVFCKATGGRHTWNLWGLCRGPLHSSYKQMEQWQRNVMQCMQTQCEHEGKTQQKFCCVLCKYMVIVLKSIFMKVKINSPFLTPPLKEYTHTQAKVIRLFNDREHALISSKPQLGLKLMTI